MFIARMVRRFTSLSIALEGDEPPSEFRIFRAGANETTKGTFVFDDAAAKSVMVEYRAHGIDLPIDYDHASLAPVTLDPAQSGKAAGWFNLEVRGGELWAVNVRWCPPAAEALRAKEWRFMSPAFQADDSGRVTSLLNVAITNLPATRRLEPLMAASITALGERMDPKLIGQALDALVAGDAEKCMELLKGIIAAAAGGDPDASTEDAPPPAGDGGSDEGQEMSGAPAQDPKKDKSEEVVAALSAIQSLSGKGLVASVEDIRTWHSSHIKLETETKKLADREAVLESAERRKGCVDLVTLGGFAPAMVWADDKASTPKKYLASMPIDDFRDYVKDAIASKGSKKATPPPAVKPPVSGGAVALGLSAEEIKICEQLKCEPAVFAKLKAQRDSVKTAGADK